MIHKDTYLWLNQIMVECLNQFKREAKLTTYCSGLYFCQSVQA